jgi:hypothetical protein
MKAICHFPTNPPHPYRHCQFEMWKYLAEKRLVERDWEVRGWAREKEE